MATRPLGTVPPPPETRIAGWIVAIYLMLRALLLALPLLLGFVLTTSLLGGVIESERVRWVIGLGVCLVAPLLVRFRVEAFLARRHKRGTPSAGWFLALANTLLCAILAFGFADDVGRALRRHGDWFVGERNGAVARSYRSGMGVMAAYLEKLDPPPELAPIIIPPDPAKIPEGPWRPGETPPEAQATVVGWFHPLAGPRRAMPMSEGRRFGALRPQPRPSECELGHCGVDLGSAVGEPVFAIFDGTIERIERDEANGGRAGRYVRIGHKDGTVVSRYIHLDTIRDGLKEGDHVSGGQLIGRIGLTGIEHSGPHLHFGLSKREGGRGGRELYIDPEPYLRTWQLPDTSSLRVASR